MSEDGKLDVEFSHRIQCGWKAWRKLSGVLCDKKMNVRLTRKVYKTAVRPAMMYGSRTWGDKEGTRKVDDCCRDEDIVQDVWSHKERQNQK